MLSPQIASNQELIEEASKNAIEKKVLYLYDDTGNRELLGVFSKSKVSRVKKYFRNKDMINQLTEFDVRTTEPDTPFNLF
jgi:hypothetical protein